MLPTLGTNLLSPRRGVSLLDDFDDQLERLWGRYRPETLDHWHPIVEVGEDEHNVVVRAELPGVQAKDVHVSMREEHLIIQGAVKQDDDRMEWSERTFGKFFRSIHLPCQVHEEKIEAACRDGILTVTLPKSEKAVAREIPVKA